MFFWYITNNESNVITDFNTNFIEDYFSIFTNPLLIDW